MPTGLFEAEHEEWPCKREIESSLIKRAYKRRPRTEEDQQYNRYSRPVVPDTWTLIHKEDVFI